jgi:hypothetical protein
MKPLQPFPLRNIVVRRQGGSLMANYSLAATIFSLALLVGCNSKPKAVPKIVALETEQYSFEVESRGPGEPIVSSRSPHGAPDGKLQELVEISWGDEQKLRIEIGKLTVNAKDRGTLAKGDRIKLEVSGRVLVNGIER